MTQSVIVQEKIFSWFNKGKKVEKKERSIGKVNKEVENIGKER